MKRVCVFLAGGFEEIEAVTIIDVLRRAGITVVTAGVGGLRVQGAHGIVMMADMPLSEARQRSWDMLVLPGGMPGATHLRDDPGVQQMIKDQHGRGGRLAAICAAPIALQAAGVLRGVRATSYPGFQDQLAGSRYQEERVVVDGLVTTSRGPGTALAFALQLVSDLVGPEVAARLAAGLLVAG